MIGKRRFIVMLVALALCAGVEATALLTGHGGWSAQGQMALLGLVAFYFGGDALSKRAAPKV